MALDATRRTTAENFLSSLNTTIAPQQITYRDAVIEKVPRGRYSQCLLSHTTSPDPAVTTTPDRLAVTTTDTLTSWNTLGTTFAAKIPVAVAVDVYDGPQGIGYVLRAEVIVGGVRHLRVKHCAGAETWREKDWVEVIPLA